MSAFDAATLDMLREARTIRIETSRGPGSPVHETPIWVVVDEGGRVFVRSEYGERGRWYRELRANPHGAVHVGSTRIPVRAEHAPDSDRVEACSRALSAKYKTSRGSLAIMLRTRSSRAPSSSLARNAHPSAIARSRIGLAVPLSRWGTTPIRSSP